MTPNTHIQTFKKTSALVNNEFDLSDTSSADYTIELNCGFSTLKNRPGLTDLLYLGKLSANHKKQSRNKKTKYSTASFNTSAATSVSSPSSASVTKKTYNPTLAQIKNSKSSFQHSIQKMRALINNNFSLNSSCITLTYKDSTYTPDKLMESNRLFHNFITVLKRKFNNLAYIGVVSVQKRGVLHYHVIFNLPLASMDAVQKLWKHGISSVQELSDVGKTCNYFIKNINFFRNYCTNNQIAYILKSSHRFLSSNNLQKTVVLSGSNPSERSYIIKILQQENQLGTKKEPFQYQNEYSGDIYEIFHLDYVSPTFQKLPFATRR